MNIIAAGDGPHLLRRVIQLHFVERTGMILFALLWLRYTLRGAAINNVYSGLPVRDRNLWSKLPPRK